MKLENAVVEQILGILADLAVANEETPAAADELEALKTRVDALERSPPSASQSQVVLLRDDLLALVHRVRALESKASSPVAAAGTIADDLRDFDALRRALVALREETASLRADLTESGALASSPAQNEKPRLVADIESIRAWITNHVTDRTEPRRHDTMETYNAIVARITALEMAVAGLKQSQQSPAVPKRSFFSRLWRSWR